MLAGMRFHRPWQLGEVCDAVERDFGCGVAALEHNRLSRQPGSPGLTPHSPKLAGARDDLVQLSLGVAAAVGERDGQVLPVVGVQAVGFAGGQHFERRPLLGVLRRRQQLLRRMKVIRNATGTDTKTFAASHLTSPGLKAKRG